jgi:hypothetical protein
LVVLKAIADPSYTSPRLSAEMLALMTNTSFEDRLPEPLSEETRVAHKIGSYGDTFSDAGIVFPRGLRGAEDAYFIVGIAGDTTEWTTRAHTAYIPGYLPVARGAPRPTRKHNRTGRLVIAEDQRSHTRKFKFETWIAHR